VIIILVVIGGLLFVLNHVITHLTFN